MAFFGLFGKDGAAALRKHAARVANRRAQAPDRWESIHALVRMKTPEAAEALLPRFTYYVEPSITDQEEKDAAFEGIMNVGEAAVPAIVAFMTRAESLSWPLKMLDRLATPERVVSELVSVLQAMDTEYERDPQRKIQVLSALEERKDDRIVAAVARFVEDVHETTRYHAVGAVFAQELVPDDVRASLTELLKREESVRIRARVLEGFGMRGWDLGAARNELSKSLPPGFVLDGKGVPKRANV